jgi:hypothetical protein
VRRQLAEAQDKADLQRDTNLEALNRKVAEEKEKLNELIEKSESENLMNKETPNNMAIEELQKLYANFEKTMKKVEESRAFEKVLNVSEADIPQIEEFNRRFGKRDKLWRNRQDFKTKKTKWYLEEFLQQDAETTVKEIATYHRQNHEMKMKM